MGKKKIGLVTGPWAKDNYSIFETSLKFIRLLEPFSESITWAVTNGNTDEKRISQRVRLIKLDLEDGRGKPTVLKAFYNARQQVRLLRAMRSMKDADVIVFAFGPNVLLLPVLYAKWFLRKKIIFRIETRLRDTLHQAGVHPAFTRIADRVERFVFAQADVIGTEYPSQAEALGLQAYRSKIAVMPLYIDTGLFREKGPYTSRKYDVGFVGRLSGEKGALELAMALPAVLNSNVGGRAIIVGQGPLKPQMDEALKSVSDRVDFAGWVEPSRVPEFLNDMKLLVVPSRIEGLPNVALEAMACGTPVLASMAGGMPDVIKDGETGFLLRAVEAPEIAAGISEALKCKDIDMIIARARENVAASYDYQTVSGMYASIIEKLAP